MCDMLDAMNASYLVLPVVNSKIRGFPRGVPDGPVCLNRYLRAPQRIVWVLREVNDTETKQWDLSDFLCNHLFDYPRWHCTFGLVAKVSRALLQRPVPETLPRITAREAADALRDIAIVNVKKTGGSSRLDWSDFLLGANKFQPLLQRQLAALDPEIVLAAGTGEFIPDPSGSEAKVIRTYHPAQRHLKHAEFYDCIFRQLAARVH